MTSIAFLDPVAAQPYGGEASHGLAQGGTEATVVRVAQQLSRLGHRVVVGQRARSRPERDSAGVAFLPYSPEHPLEQAASFSNVVVLGDSDFSRKAGKFRKTGADERLSHGGTKARRRERGGLKMDCAGAGAGGWGRE